MSTNFNAPKSYDSWNQTEKWENNISKLPTNIKEQVKQETKAELTKLDADMQKISHKNFLADVDFPDRLKHITDPNIDASELSETSKIEFNFSFTSEKENRNLFLLTTAGQVLPQSVDNVTTTDGKQYSRESISGEFFSSDGKRLIIRDKTQITIGDLRTHDEIAKLEKQATELLKNIQGATDENRELLSMWASKGINPELVLKFFSAFFGSKSFTEITSSMQEDFLTQVDREIGYMNMDEKRADKNNLSQEAQDELVARMGDKTSMDSIDYELISSEVEFLDFIWSLESKWNYNAIYWVDNQSEINFTQMTLSEILDYQTSHVSKWNYSAAIWKYQFIHKTLVELIEKYWFSMDQKFDEEFQDKIALIKMHDRGLWEYYAGKKPAGDFALELAKEWAAFPIESTGKSYYNDDGVNKSQIWYDQFIWAVHGLKSQRV